jgi:hypothetical protein
MGDAEPCLGWLLGEKECWWGWAVEWGEEEEEEKLVAGEAVTAT